MKEVKLAPVEQKKYIFMLGAKSIGQYGGFESFLDHLTEQHKDETAIQYYIATKANGVGFMDETKLKNVIPVDNHTFIYHGAYVIKFPVPKIGAAQAVVYDIKAFKYCLKYCEQYKISSPIIYVMACRLGPFFGGLVRRAHRLGAVVYINPDGHEWKRTKWSAPVRRYWKESERLMVKHADKIVCDSVNIEKYIKKEYEEYKPNTTFIAYGSDTKASVLADDDPKFTEWLKEKGLKAGQYYMCCGRFVPENSFEIMIREFMKSKSLRDFAIITTQNNRFLEKLDSKLHFKSDHRIKFVGTVYDSELLKKIRESAYANFHGHTVGGTNPSLLEALGSTDVNLLINVGFNREVAEDAALYWKSSEGSLTALIDRVDAMSTEERTEMGKRAKERIRTAYSWKFIADEYENLWMKADKANCGRKQGNGIWNKKNTTIWMA